MTHWTRRGFIGSLSAAAAARAFAALPAPEKRAGQAPIKITDLRCAIIGSNPTVRIVTDQGVSGYGQAESYKPYLKPMVLFYKDYLIGEDPTDVARVMLKIRRMGAFKPWGAAVSAIEIALWDIAGQVAGVPVYKLLGGKIRDRVRIYNGAVRFPMTGHTPQDYAETMAKMKRCQRRFHPDQTSRRISRSGDDARGAQCLVRRAAAQRGLASRPWNDDRARPRQCHRLRRGHEEGPRQ